MRNRSIRTQVWLNEKEDILLTANAKKAGLSRESYLRILINGYIPKSLPPLDYHAMIQELHSIGVNMNQIAAQANSTGHIDKTVFQYEANRLRRAVLDIQAAFTSPEKRCDDGNHSDLGCERPP